VGCGLSLKTDWGCKPPASTVYRRQRMMRVAWALGEAKMKLRITFVFVVAVGVACVSLAASSEIDERRLLRDSYFGDFRNATIQRESAATVLEVWQPYFQYRVSALPRAISKVLLEGSRELNVDYDEIWIWERKGSDVSKLYWKHNEIQAATAAKYFLNDPLTGARLSPPSYQIINIYDRNFILEKLRERQ
jgi:hypothetical protein